ncbi:hypothetical protein [Psychroserpens luteus]|uniref:Oxygen tolerance n=1 Tax=Psychroserpens luteus TaxID=1434066 RepID=A0ABW5ZUF1_9FLAO|nr:hypothetical protein [Psychroserpens luteus]
MRLKHIYILLLGLIVLSSYTTIQDNEITLDIKLLTTQTEFEAGSTIVLKFSTSEGIRPKLYCSSSYGSTVVTPSNEGTTLSYSIPKNISKKTGQVHWKLLNDATSLSGQFKIVPIQEVVSMETYIGPPSIEAGGTDYTMLVVIPTDSLDNALPDNTTVDAKHQFLLNETSDAILTKNSIAYKNIYSEEKSGRMLISSESKNTNSKEFTITVFPAIPTNFKISALRPHNYADGNQVTTFETSIIKDKQNNVVSDGTYVSFYITNEKSNSLKTSGTTINGVATAKMIHPDYETQWSIKAYVDGMAESDVITLDYNKVIEDFEMSFSKNNRVITVGPLQSFMKQMIPDGLLVKLLVYKDDVLLETLHKTSIDGFVNFNLNPNSIKNDIYKIVITTAGLEKTVNALQLW